MKQPVIIRRSTWFVILAVCLLTAIPTLFADSLVESQADPQTPSPAPAPTGMRIIRPTLPAWATQADRGAQIYVLVCSACHGDRGQGLTDEWRATWNPRDQNCWQTKCHAPSHPPDGFEVPHYVPPVVGPTVTQRFRTALDLYEFVKKEMPWQDPGVLQDDEYWEVTAYLIRANNIDPVRIPLDRERAASILLQATSQATAIPRTFAGPSPAPVHPSPVPAPATVTTDSSKSAPAWMAVAILVGGGIAVGLWFWLRARTHG